MWKRLFDLTLSSLALIVAAPLIGVIAIAVKLGSSGPVFYRGWRTGLHEIPFQIYKFRTMVADAESRGGPSTALHDVRLTTVGRFLRRHKLDELPQFFNIVKGEMSVVGPRPQVERYTKLYRGNEKLILTVKPGLTDYASIHFINMDETLGDGDVDDKYLRDVEPAKNRLRLRYVREQSLLLDMKIIALTVLRMLGIKRWNISG